MTRDSVAPSVAGRTEPHDLAALRALAEKATPGPWRDLTHGTASQEAAAQMAYGAVMARRDPDCPDCQWTDLSWVETTPDGPHIALTGNGPNAAENADFIAAFDPTTAVALLSEIESLRVAINGFRWVGNNLHNAGTDAFEGYFRAALEDARRAMGDDWEPMKLPRKVAATEPAEREAAR